MDSPFFTHKTNTCVWTGGLQRKERNKLDKRLAWKVSANGEIGGGKPTPKIHRGNLDRRSEPPDPRKGRSGSNRGKRRIPLLGYED